MSCSPFDLRDYYLQELSDPQRRQVEAHVKDCPACREELDQLRLTQAALFSLREEEIPQRIAFVSDAVFEPSPAKRWWTAFWGSPGRLGFAGAALLSATILFATLSNVRPGAGGIGNAELSAATTITVGGLNNNAGTITIDGNNANQATLNVTSVAGSGTTGALSGEVHLSGNGLLEFASGQITSSAVGAEVSLDGPEARIATASIGTTSNSALTMLASSYGILELEDGAKLTTTVDFSNGGSLQLDRFDGNDRHYDCRGKAPRHDSRHLSSIAG